jgi:hypothetical protein
MIVKYLSIIIFNKDESSHSLIENLSSTATSHTLGFQVFHYYGGIFCLKSELGTVIEITSVVAKKINFSYPVSWRPSPVLSDSFILPL